VRLFNYNKNFNFSPAIERDTVSWQFWPLAPELTVLIQIEITRHMRFKVYDAEMLFKNRRFRNCSSLFH